MNPLMMLPSRVVKCILLFQLMKNGQLHEIAKKEEIMIFFCLYLLVIFSPITLLQFEGDAGFLFLTLQAMTDPE